MLISVWQRVFNSHKANLQKVPGVLSTTEFKRTIAEERVRSERTHIGFSLLTFRATSPQDKPNTLLNLQLTAIERLRVLDKIGWLDRDTVGVLMPITSSSDAIHVAEEINAKLAQRKQPVPEFEVFTYPLTEQSDRNDDSHQVGNSDLEDKILKECSDLQEMLETEKSDESGTPAASTDTQAVDSSTSSNYVVHPMTDLFIRPMPVWKRLLDITGASLGLVATAPILLLSMLAIKVTSPGPAIFSQNRTGLAGRKFRIYKLRSMVTDAETRKKELMDLNEQDGPAFKIAHDPRITAVGRFLRATSIDELPQLWNVLIGDMSLVGPRPLPCSETDACHGWLRRRLDVTPGLTCGWQTQPERNRITFDDWTRMDVRYIQERSMWTDIKHVWRTFGVIVGRRSV